MSEAAQRSGRRQALAWAAAGVLFAFAAQAALVHERYEGRWSGLFYTGTGVAPPAALDGENPPRAPDAVGFDGQFYHFIAHDPLLRTDAKQFVDNPPLRWRRILTPGAAYLLALGRPGAVDAAYFAVILLSLFAGLYWSARFMQDCGLPAAAGLAFLILPATMISLERMTVDITFCALAAGAAVHLRRPASWRLYAILTLAPLARETGLVLAGARGLSQLLGRRIGPALACGATVAPFLLWSVFVHLRTSSDGTAWFSGRPFEGLILRTLSPLPDPAVNAWLRTAAQLDYVGILGVWAAIALTIVALRRRPRGELELASLLLLTLFAFLGKEDIWSQAYGFGRTLSPAFLWLALIAARDRRPVLLLPWALAAPRILFQAQTLAGF